MKLPHARTGSPLLVKSTQVEFSYWPMVKTVRRWGVHSTLYAANPWGVIAGTVHGSLKSTGDKEAARSFVNQAREYFTAAERADTIETRPLLYYYAFLNLAKAIAMARGRQGLVGKVVHGVAAVAPAGHTIATAKLAISRSSHDGSNVSIVDELHVALHGTQVSAADYPVREVLAQSVVGHRIWREAYAQLPKERFIQVDRLRLMHDPEKRAVWSELAVRRSVLRARDRGATETLRNSGLHSTFALVSAADPTDLARFHVFEQAAPTYYTGRAADVVMDAVSVVKPHLWSTVTVNRPYRNYYLYLSPQSELRMPQWLSIYSTLFWLGSLARYQPVSLLEGLNGPFGPFLREFLETQPSQLLYLLASEVKRQDIARAAIV